MNKKISISAIFLMAILFLSVAKTPFAQAMVPPADLGDWMDFSIQNYRNEYSSSVYEQFATSDPSNAFTTYHILTDSVYDSEGSGQLFIVNSGDDPSNNVGYMDGAVMGEMFSKPGSYFNWTMMQYNSSGQLLYSDSDFHNASSEQDNFHDDFHTRTNATYDMIFPEMQEPVILVDDIDVDGWIDVLNRNVRDLFYDSPNNPALEIVSRSVDYLTGNFNYTISPSITAIYSINAEYRFNDTWTTHYDHANLPMFQNPGGDFTILLYTTYSFHAEYDADNGHLLYLFTEVNVDVQVISTVYFSDPQGSWGANITSNYYLTQSNEVIPNYITWGYGGSRPGVDSNYVFNYGDWLEFVSNYGGSYSASMEMRDSYSNQLMFDKTDYHNDTGNSTSDLMLAFTDNGGLQLTQDFNDFAFWGVFTVSEGHSIDGWVEHHWEGPNYVQNSDQYPNDYYDQSYEFFAIPYNSTHPLIYTGEEYLDPWSFFMPDEGKGDPFVSGLLSQMGEPSATNSWKHVGNGQQWFFINGYDRYLNYVRVGNHQEASWNYQVTNLPFGPDGTVNGTVNILIVSDPEATYDVNTNILLSVHEYQHAELTFQGTALFDRGDGVQTSTINFSVNVDNNNDIFLKTIPYFYQEAPTYVSNTTSSSSSNETFNNQTESTNSSSEQTPILPLPGFEAPVALMALATIATVVIRKRT